MKTTAKFTVFIILAFLFNTNKSSSQTPPPQYFSIDPVTSLATWNAPDNPDPDGYVLFMDNQQLEITSDTSYNYGYFWYGSSHLAGIAAIYPDGNSDTIEVAFTSEYLIPPDSLEGEAYGEGDAAYLTWSVPVFPVNPDSVPGNLIGYNIYRDGDSIDHVGYDTTEYFDINPGGVFDQAHLYTLDAVYDLSPYGYPGEIGGSGKAGPVEVVIIFCCGLPFYENFSAGTLGYMNWNVYCDNWMINLDEGNPHPAAEFQGHDSLSNYSCGLETWDLGSFPFEEGFIYADFDLKLEDLSGSETEFFKLYIHTPDAMHEVLQVTNAGSFDWQSYHIDISEYTIANPDFTIYFAAEGDDGSNIDAWGLDNILIYFVCPAPYDLTAIMQANYVHLSWESPDTASGKALSGFNVYREWNDSGEWIKLNEDPITETWFDDQPVDTGSYKYYTNAVFDGCTSIPSNVAEISLYTGFSEITKITDRLIFPNPADEFLILKGYPEDAILTIKDITGKEITKSMPVNGGQTKINTSGFPDGMYFICIENAGKTNCSKLLISH